MFRVHLAMSENIFGGHNCGRATGLWGAEARDAAEHPVMYRTVPPTKNYLSSNNNGAEAEKLRLEV